MKVIFWLAVILVVILIVLGMFYNGTDILSDSILPALYTACDMNSNCTW